MFVVAKLLCPYSKNGRLYPSGLIKQLVERGDFNGLPVILGHTSHRNPRPKVIGRIIKAKFDNDSRCAVGLIEIDENKLDMALLNMLKKGRIAFSIEGEATSVEFVSGETIVKDAKLNALALVAEPGIMGARPLAIASKPIELTEGLLRSVNNHENSMGGSLMAEENVGYVKPDSETLENGTIEVITEQDNLNAPSYAGPVYVNVNVNVTGREQTESKVQSQKGEEEDEGEQTSGYEKGETQGTKFQVQKGKQIEGLGENEECLDEACKKKKAQEETEECVDETCKKKKASEEDCIDEACKKKKAKEEECVDEACKKKKSNEENDVPELAREEAKAEVLESLFLASLAKAEFEEILAEDPELKEELSDEDLEFVKGVLSLVVEAKSNDNQDDLVAKCEKLSKKYGIPCILSKGIKPAHPECIGNDECCDPVNGFWPINKPGRAKLAIYLIFRHWVKMANRYGLKGWAKVVDCIVYKAKTKYGIDVQCKNLKQRQPSIWQYLQKAKKVCVEEEFNNVAEDLGRVMSKVSEASFANVNPQFDIDTAFLKLTEQLASGKVPIAEDINNADSILLPIAQKIHEFTRTAKVWGKVGQKVTLSKDRMIVGAPIKIPVLDYRFSTAQVIDTYPPAGPTEVDETLATVDMVVKRAQASFSWSEDLARLISGVGQFAVRNLTERIRNTLDAAVTAELKANSTPVNFNPADTTTIPNVNLNDIWDAETYLTTEGYAVDYAIMPPALITALAKVETQVREALAYAKRLEPGQVIEMLGLNIIVGDKHVTPVEDVGGDKVAYAYLFDSRALVTAESNGVDLAPAYYPERDNPYLLVAKKYFAVKVIKQDAVAMLAFKL